MLNVHVDEIHAAIAGKRMQRDSVILESWNRCVRKYKLDPERENPVQIHTQNQVRLHQQELEDFMLVAKSGLEDLYRRVAGMGYVLLLANSRGITVDLLGDHRVDKELRHAGLYLGSDWREEEVGTCGLGSCLATGEPIVVHQSDHFGYSHAPLSCVSAPIYDVFGNLTAVLDISLLRTDTRKAEQALALDLVKTTVRNIEMAGFMSSFRNDAVLRFSASPEFADVDPHAAIALSSSGTIIGMTREAQKFLIRAETGAATGAVNPIGRQFSDYFEMNYSRLPELDRNFDVQSRALVARSGEVVFANAMMPRNRSAAKPQQTLPGPLAAIHGGDVAMTQLAKKAARIADSRISVIMYGETGVGKEYVVRAMHESRKNPGPFVAINCAALPENLIESELFGYAPGAFTGALAKGKRGLVELANGGTLFLDEIGDMPLALQARLLRVLAEREVMPIGGSSPVKVNVRFVSASHKDLQSLVKLGQFRQDLYYRLNGIMLEIPPIRKREDLSWLVDSCLRAVVGEDRSISITPGARQVLQAYDWPGNVRELLNALELAVALCDEDTIDTKLLTDLFPQFNSDSADLDGDLGDFAEGDTVQEREQLLELLREHSWNVSGAARKLSVDRSTLHRRMRRLGIKHPI